MEKGIEGTLRKRGENKIVGVPGMPEKREEEAKAALINIVINNLRKEAAEHGYEMSPLSRGVLSNH